MAPSPEMQLKSFLSTIGLIFFASSALGAQSSWSVSDLRAAIAGARAGSRVNIPAGVYNIGNTPIRIEDKRNVVISGAGEGRTVIQAGASAPFILELAGTNTNLTVANMSLYGASRLAKNTHGLAEGPDRMTLTGGRFHNLDIRNVAVGISVVGSGTGYCDNVQITGNHLDNIQEVFTPTGTTSGSGYGIHNESCTNVRIADNVIRNADRHSIYQAKAYQPDRPPATGSIVIEHNLIINHASTSALNREFLVAIVVARSSNVTVAHNVIVNPYHDAISIEDPLSEAASYVVKNVKVIDNAVLGSRGSDIFLTATSGTLSGNRFFHAGSSGEPASTSVRRDGKGMIGRLTNQPFTGSSQTVVAVSTRDAIRRNPPGNGPVHGMAAYNGKVYVYSGSCFYEVDATSHASVRVGC
jgi:hypothetical protein